MTRTWCLAVLVLGTLVAVPNVQAQTKKISFAIHELGTLAGGQTSWVRDINDLGQVAGYVSDGTNRRACIWEPNGQGEWTIRDLGASVYYSNPVAYGINDCGQVAGHTMLGSPSAAFFYDDITGEFETLPFAGCQPSTSKINNFGFICGGLGTALLWEPANGGTWNVVNLADVGESIRASSVATDINDNMQIVGYSENAPNDIASRVVHLWERNASGEWTVSDPSGTAISSASAINMCGQIAGAMTVNGIGHAGIWERIDGDWFFTDLSVLASDISSSGASAINDQGDVLINANLSSGGTTRYLFKNGNMYDLNKCLPTGSGWSLWTGHAVNTQGCVVGGGYYNPAGANRAYLMDTRAVTYSYTSTGGAVSIKDKSTAVKSMTLTDNEMITDLNVKVTLYHTRYADLKFELVGPDNVTRVLCNAGAVTGSGTKTLVFDDDGSAGSIAPAVPLNYYDGTSTLGKWTLKISDTVKNFKTGSFTSFTLDLVPAL